MITKPVGSLTFAQSNSNISTAKTLSPNGTIAKAPLKQLVGDCYTTANKPISHGFKRGLAIALASIGIGIPTLGSLASCGTGGGTDPDVVKEDPYVPPADPGKPTDPTPKTGAQQASDNMKDIYTKAGATIEDSSPATSPSLRASTRDASSDGTEYLKEWSFSAGGSDVKLTTSGPVDGNESGIKAIESSIEPETGIPADPVPKEIYPLDNGGYRTKNPGGNYSDSFWSNDVVIDGTKRSGILETGYNAAGAKTSESFIVKDSEGVWKRFIKSSDGSWKPGIIDTITDFKLIFSNTLSALNKAFEQGLDLDPKAIKSLCEMAEKIGGLKHFV